MCIQRHSLIADSSEIESRDTIRDQQKTALSEERAVESSKLRIGD